MSPDFAEYFNIFGKRQFKSNVLKILEENHYYPPDPSGWFKTHQL